MKADFIHIIKEIEREKDIPVEILVEAVQAALESAYKKSFGAACDLRVLVNWDEAEFRVFMRKVVVEKVENPIREISLAEAKKEDKNLELGDIWETELSVEHFGRIAAQTAKQVIVQRVREAERELLYDEFKSKTGEIVTGIVVRKEPHRLYVDLGKIEAVLPAAEQIPNENYRISGRIKVYIVDVKKTPKGPHILLSRTHPGLVRRLFELEVPEIQDRIVEIKGIVREPGYRVKVAVASNDENVDPVGACVGARGNRVLAITNELSGERIDVIRWAEDTKVFIENALSPAKVLGVNLVDEEERSAEVVVAKDQLSLAIGKQGQNVRLAARLTGWRIDIKGEEEVAEEAEKAEEVEAGEESKEIEEEAKGPDEVELPGVSAETKEDMESVAGREEEG